MKQILFVFALLLSLQLSAQDNQFNPYYQIEADKNYFLLADAVNLRSKPDAKSEVLAKLQIGIELKILQVTETDFELNGFSAPWLKVSANGKTGYIWAGFLSISNLKSASNPDLIFLVGISKVVKKKMADYESDAVTMQIRVCQNNKEIQKLEYDGKGSLSTARSADLLVNKGVSGVESILDIEYSDNFCGGSFGNHIFFWDGKKLYFVKHLQSGADAPCFSSEDFIYPADESGKANTILMKVESGCSDMESESDEIVYDTHRMEEYVWKNNKLVFVKKYDLK